MAESKDKNMVVGLDEQGNPVFGTPEQWRKEVLPNLLEQAWDDTNMLYGLITLAADNDMAEDVLAAVEHAYQIDPIAERGATMFAILLIRTGRIDQAEAILKTYFEKHGETGTTLSVLARVHAARGDEQTMIRTLRRGLQLDPNDEMALDWYGKYFHEKEGKDAGEKALKEIAALPGAWRPHTWLAHKAIQDKDKTQAIAYYKVAIDNSDQGPEAVTLAGMDLLSAGYVIEMILMLENIYDPRKHGLDAGVCLVEGYIRTGQKEKGILMLNKVEGSSPDLGEKWMEMRGKLAKLPNEA